MTYDIGLTCGIEDKTKEGAASIANNLKKIAAVVAGGYGINKAFENMFKYGEAIKKRRTFQIMGGNLEMMRSASMGVVSDLELMAMYTQLASRNMTKYSLDLAAAAGRLNELGIDPEVLMKASAGGKLGLLQRFLPGDVKSKIKGARTEEEKLLILLKAMNSENIKSISSYDLLSDRIETFATKIKNFTQGPGIALLKTIGYITFSVGSFGLALLPIKSSMKKWLGYFSNMGSLIFHFPGHRLFLIGELFRKQIGTPLMGHGKMFASYMWNLTKLSAVFYTLRGVIRGLGLDKALSLVPEFISGFSIKDSRFMLHPSTISKINATAPNMFRWLGKMIIFATNAGTAFVDVFDTVGKIIGKVMGTFGLGGAGGGKSGWKSGGAILGSIIGIGVVADIATAPVRGLWKMLRMANAVPPFLTVISSGFLKLGGVLKFVGKNWKAALGIGLIITAIEMWRELADSMGGWGKVWDGVVELMKWGWESIVRFVTWGTNAMIDGLNKVLSVYNNVAYMFGGESATFDIPRISDPYGSATGAGKGMTSEQIEKNYQDARNTINKLNTESAAKKAKEGDVNVNVNIDGTKIDQVRHSRTRSQQAKTVGVKQ